MMAPLHNTVIRHNRAFINQASLQPEYESHHYQETDSFPNRIIPNNGGTSATGIPSANNNADANIDSNGKPPTSKIMSETLMRRVSFAGDTISFPDQGGVRGGFQGPSIDDLLSSSPRIIKSASLEDIYSTCRPFYHLEDSILE